MKTKLTNILAIAIAAFTSSVLTALLGFIAVYVYIILPFQKDAVDKGFAVWEVTDNATGSTQFQWVEYSALEALAQNEKPLK
tara:strand:+ start:525 stop:770 length:246 start_codon:yes stop_codon:yes gene_type:complete